MNQILQPGLSVKVGVNETTCQVGQFLGGGGQGEVYQATVDGQAFALKWYFPHAATPFQHNILQMLIGKGAPTKKFLWPLDIAHADNVQGFGYVMPLREERYKGILDLMTGRVNPIFRALTTLGYELAASYYALHAQGLCYRDISFGNAFFDPDSGEALICDNDNVSINKQEGCEILGTPRFMAPEIVRGEALPSTSTDLFSLSVLLFHIFMVAHPLDGAKEDAIHCFDLPAMTKLYGLEPVFIFDPNNDSNRPVPGRHDNALIFWPIYPEFLRRLFIEAFTKGLQDPDNGRVREGVWRDAMLRLRDAIIYCGHCGAENFYDGEALRASGGQPSQCWSCHQTLRLPPRIRIGRDKHNYKVIMLNHDTHLYAHHVDEQRRFDFASPIAKLVAHPTQPNVWGLENLSQQKWTCTTGNGAIKDVEPGKRVPLAVGTKINFGPSEGEINL